MTGYVIVWALVLDAAHSPAPAAPSPELADAHVRAGRIDYYDKLRTLTVLARFKLQERFAVDRAAVESCRRLQTELERQVAVLEPLKPQPAQRPYLPMVGHDPFDPSRPKPPVRD